MLPCAVLCVTFRLLSFRLGKMVELETKLRQLESALPDGLRKDSERLHNMGYLTLEDCAAVLSLTRETVLGKLKELALTLPTTVPLFKRALHGEKEHYNNEIHRLGNTNLRPIQVCDPLRVKSEEGFDFLEHDHERVVIRKESLKVLLEKLNRDKSTNVPQNEKAFDKKPPTRKRKLRSDAADNEFLVQSALKKLIKDCPKKDFLKKDGTLNLGSIVTELEWKKEDYELNERGFGRKSLEKHVSKLISAGKVTFPC